MINKARNYYLVRSQLQCRHTGFVQAKTRAVDGKFEPEPQIRGLYSILACTVRRSVETAARVIRGLIGFRAGAYGFNTAVASCLTLGFVSMEVLTTAPVKIKFENQTGYSIEGVYVVPSASKNWGPDLLDDRDQLLNGESTVIRLTRETNAGLFDVKVRFLGGGEWSWTNDHAIYLRNAQCIHVEAAGVIQVINNSREEQLR